MRIHFGAGRHILPGYFNADAVQHPNAERPLDMVYEMRFDGAILVQPMPLDDGCAEELFAAHVIEHFARYEVDAVIGEWKRLLQPGGRLILELPNLEACARNLLAGARPQMCMFGIYGDESWKSPYMLHKFGYTPATLSALLAEHGFTNIQVLPPQTHGAKVKRDMRVEAIKQ